MNKTYYISAEVKSFVCTADMDPFFKNAPSRLRGPLNKFVNRFGREWKMVCNEETGEPLETKGMEFCEVTGMYTGCFVVEAL